MKTKFVLFDVCFACNHDNFIEIRFTFFVNLNFECFTSKLNYLHECLKIETFMRRNEIKIINEKKLLQIIDFAFTFSKLKQFDIQYNDLIHNHLFTNVEFDEFKKQHDLKIDKNNYILMNSRALFYSTIFVRNNQSTNTNVFNIKYSKQ